MIEVTLKCYFPAIIEKNLRINQLCKDVGEYFGHSIPGSENCMSEVRHGLDICKEST